MNKFSKIMFTIWMVLAVSAFVSSFWAIGLVKIIGLVFGGLNMLIISSWISETVMAMKKMKEE